MRHVKIVLSGLNRLRVDNSKLTSKKKQTLRSLNDKA